MKMIGLIKESCFFCVLGKMTGDVGSIEEELEQKNFSIRKDGRVWTISEEDGADLANIHFVRGVIESI